MSRTATAHPKKSSQGKVLPYGLVSQFDDALFASADGAVAEPLEGGLEEEEMILFP